MVKLTTTIDTYAKQQELMDELTYDENEVETALGRLDLETCTEDDVRTEIKNTGVQLVHLEEGTVAEIIWEAIENARELREEDPDYDGVIEIEL